MIAIFIFYSVSRGVQSRLAFSSEFKHCNTITYDGCDWMQLEFDPTGFTMRRVKTDNGQGLINRLTMLHDISAIVTVNVIERAKFGWKPYLVRSCNEICRYTAGIDVGLTFNPKHLYDKLLRYRVLRNYEVLSQWRRSDGVSKK